MDMDMENHRQPHNQPLTIIHHKHPAPAAAAAAAHDQPPLQCPRCNSTNTKFCYYNNYNLSQPRHFCKTCRRYWTKGGALRNIPVGGATRNKTKRRTRTPNKTTTAHASPLQQISVPSVEAEVVDDEQPLMLLDYCGIGSTTTFSSLLASNSNSNGQFGSYPDGDGDGGFLILGDSKGSEALWPDNWADLSIYTPGPSFQ